jgi:protein O-mannosyl-transferase
MARKTGNRKDERERERDREREHEPKPWRSGVPRRPAVVALLLSALTLFAYLPVLQNELVDYDDDYYISQNPHVTPGLTLAGAKWALTESYGANWYPLTWLSLMADTELFGTSARGYHAMNLAYHLAGTLLLLYVFLRMTGSLWASAFVAAVYALHPTHVESVAWAAERKDVLSGLFWMLTLWAYVRFSSSPAPRRLGLVALFLSLGLMSKPMVVTLPFVLLLVDVWPLDRISTTSWRRLLLEKVPLFGLVAAASVVTFYAQRAEGAVQTFDRYSFPVRFWNALLSYAAYVGKAIWPSRLSPYYPHPGDSISAVAGAAAGVMLVFVTAATVVAGLRRARLRFLPVGWLWYVGTLVPVIGIVQVGQQAMADRYTYLPYIGLSILAAYGTVELLQRFRIARYVPAAVGAAAVLSWTLVTSAQVRVWHDSVTLFEHALAVTEDNALAHINLGVAYLNRGRLDEASTQLEEAIRIHPGSAEAHGALGSVRVEQGRLPEALEYYQAALRLDPSSSRTHRELGNLLLKLGDETQAMAHFREASALSPADGDALADVALALSREGRTDEALQRFQEASTLASDRARLHQNWGTVLLGAGRPEDAIGHFQTALELRPDYPEAHFSWGQAAMAGGDFPKAVGELSEAVRLEPANEEAQYQLGLALANAGRPDEALEHFEKARELAPDRAGIAITEGLLLMRAGEPARACEYFRKSLELDPGNAEAHYSLGLAYAGTGRFEDAITCYRRALELDPSYAVAHNSWGVALASEGKVDRAVEQWKRALSIDPRLGEAHNNWGLALSNAGELDAATEHFRLAVSLEPENPDAHINLGVSLARRGKLEEAAASFERAVDLAPDDPRARQNLERARQALQGPSTGR